MRDLVDGWPFWVVLVAFWAGATARGVATYWVGRGVRAGGGRTRWATTSTGRPSPAPSASCAGSGRPPSPSAFLTVGLQSAINASSGMLRMPLRRFLPAVVLGALLWAAVYTTVGMAVVDAALGRVPWWWLLVAAGVVLLVVLAARRLRRRVDAEV